MIRATKPVQLINLIKKAVALSLLPLQLLAQPSLTIHLDQPGGKSSPVLYGLMTEEINYSYEGGIYAELVRNRSFKDGDKYWSPVGGSTLSLDKTLPVSAALNVSLRVMAEQGGAGVANAGYWGIAVRPGTTYAGSFYAKGSGSLTVHLGAYASANIGPLTDTWRKYTYELKTASDLKPTADARLEITADAPGTFSLSLVSLFPPTYAGRKNGNRADIMTLLKEMKPAFLRFPGGNFLEGNNFANRFDWKKTLGPLESRAGHQGTWGYKVSDGMGLLEFLNWCEDLHMEPVLAVFAGFALNHDYVEAGTELQGFVQDALDEIEYVTGSTDTYWGKRRALDGHPKPFTLHYVEIGNEDGFDGAKTYEKRFVQFYDAIKKKYPQLQCISTTGGKDELGIGQPVNLRKPDLVDEHYYRSAEEMELDATHYDNYDRKGPKVFVGEWATREGEPTPNFNAALGDAAWMTGMERNSDIVTLSCYAPLFVNVNKGAMQWSSDLIGYDALNSYGSPSYYAQVLFNTYKGSQVVRITGKDLPFREKELSADAKAAGFVPKKIPGIFYVATRDAKHIYLKVVNTLPSEQSIALDLSGGAIAAQGLLVCLKADKPTDTNSITEPRKMVPVKTTISGLANKFTRTFAPYSINVLQFDLK